MGLFSRKRDPVVAPPLPPLERLCQIQQETNSLLRELLAATGHAARTPLTPRQPTRQYTDKDVVVVTRADRMRMDRETQQAQAPWRATPASGPASDLGPGSTADAASPASSPAASGQTPAAPPPSGSTPPTRTP